MNEAPEASEEDTSAEAEALELIASDLLPKLVELLQDIEPRYRQRTINAALVLLG